MESQFSFLLIQLKSCIEGLPCCGHSFELPLQPRNCQSQHPLQLSVLWDLGDESTTIQNLKIIAQEFSNRTWIGKETMRTIDEIGVVAARRDALVIKSKRFARRAYTVFRTGDEQDGDLLVFHPDGRIPFEARKASREIHNGGEVGGVGVVKESPIGSDETRDSSLRMAHRGRFGSDESKQR